MFIQRFLPRTAGRMLLLTGILLSAPGAVAAQGWMEPVRPGIGVARRVETDVRVTIRGPVAEVVVDEWFQNQGSTVAEGDYLYPLSVGVALSGASLYQGETELRGEVMDAAQARGIYEAIVRRRRDPALIEYAGEGLFRARVFPIAPGERRRVTLRFTQVLETAGGSLHFRTLGALRPGGNGSEASNSRELAPVRVEIRVAGGEGFLDAFSPTHGMNQERDRDDLLVR
ncbi:MAG: VIT domain-containing protein, partial [Gemmatimonadota bacterium]|nr:VIT domain-containing protein [Gemmatimonadota bacterium]